jgi:hypothetical protein
MGKMKDMAIVAHNEEMDVPEYAQDSALMADGFEKAFIGFGTHFSHAVAIYDYDRCLDILISMFRKDAEFEQREIDPEQIYLDAVEYMEFNVTGGWVGPNTPVFLRDRRSL